MRLHVLSDLHLEFGPLDIAAQDADVLVLAGDIMVANYLTRSANSPYQVQVAWFDDFMHWARDNYKHVIYVPGNHEHYAGNLNKTVATLRERYPFINISSADFCETTIEGVKFAFGTMWTDLSNPIDAMVAEGGMNDFKVIKNGTRKLSARDTTAAFREFKRHVFLAKPDVVITHMAPSARSIAPIYQTNKLTPAYFSNLDNDIWHSGIKLWIHGHVHNSNDYMLGNTRVVSNPRGYVGHELNPYFNPGMVIEIAS